MSPTRRPHPDRATEEAIRIVLRLMQEQKVSQAELGRRIGVHQSCISKWLSSDRELSLRALSDMVWALGHTLEIPGTFSIPVVAVGHEDYEDLRRHDALDLNS